MSSSPAFILVKSYVLSIAIEDTIDRNAESHKLGLKAASYSLLVCLGGLLNLGSVSHFSSLSIIVSVDETVYEYLAYCWAC